MKSIRPFPALLKPLTQSIRPTAITRPASIRTTNQPRRQTFLTNPFTSAPQTLTASRTLSYSSSVIYDIISDVSSYQNFLPYVRESTVTKHSAVDKNGKSWPEEAKLVIGFSGDVSEEFWSRVYCVPETIVEAVSGGSNTSLPAEQISHHTQRAPGSLDPTRKSSVLSHLKTTWRMREHRSHGESNALTAQPRTEVNLAIEYQFANPLYAAMSSAVAPKVAEKMIEAFENRVKAVVEKKS